MSHLKIKLPILERKIIAEKTCEVSFNLATQNFKFLAGQYVRLTVPRLLYFDPKGASRLFSIASSPHDKTKLSIAFRDSGSGFKRTLMELAPGSAVDIEGPFGRLTLPNDASMPFVFLAGGIGITPFLSMLRFINDNKLNYSITLIYANKNRESAAYLEELEKIAAQNPRFVLKNKFGLLDSEFIRQSINNTSEALWLIAGPPAMIEETKNILIRLGVTAAKIYLERFTGYE